MAAIPSIPSIDSDKLALSIQARKGYTLDELKTFARYYQVKVSGKKAQLVQRLQNVVNHSSATPFSILPPLDPLPPSLNSSLPSLDSLPPLTPSLTALTLLPPVPITDPTLEQHRIDLRKSLIKERDKREIKCTKFQILLNDIIAQRGTNNQLYVGAFNELTACRNKLQALNNELAYLNSLDLSDKEQKDVNSLAMRLQKLKL